jgi:hypothetical protein
MNIEIKDTMSVTIGELRSLGVNDVENERLLDILASSRNSYSGSFFTDSKSDINSTRKFLQNFVGSEKKFIFLIYINNKSTDSPFLYGHLGYEIVDSQRIEIINVMKVPDSNSGVRMFLPLSSLISYLKSIFPEAQIFLRVLKSNKRAISMYALCGFEASTNESVGDAVEMILSKF